MQFGRVVFRFSGAIAFAFLAASTVLTILDAVDTTTPYSGMVVGAAVVEAVALGCLVLVLVLRSVERPSAPPRTWRQHLLASCICAIVATAAASLTLAELAVRKGETSSRSDDTRGAARSPRLNIDIAVCAVSAVAQAVFFITSIVTRPRLGCNQYTRSQEDVRPATQTQKEPTPPMSLRILTPPRTLSRRDSNPSPTLTNNSSNSLPSLRSSVNQLVRPITSKTKLITSRERASSDAAKLTQSLHSSIDSLNRLDGFDTWDTSDVDSQNRDAVMQAAPRRPPVLEPIPGSRPASRNLDTLEAALPKSPRDARDAQDAQDARPDSSSATPSPVSPTDQTSSPIIDRPITAYSHYTARSRQAGSTVSLAASTRTRSPSVSEAHIHPLFRTDSPTPPPAATPGTIIHASPRGGQYIAAPNRPYSRMGSTSRETLRARSPSLLRSASYETVTDRISTAQSTVTTPSRELTPPIPDFVLSGVK